MLEQVVDVLVTQRRLRRRRRTPRPERPERPRRAALTPRGRRRPLRRRARRCPPGCPPAVEQVAQLGVEVVVAQLARRVGALAEARAGRRGRRRWAAGGDSSRRRRGPRRPGGCAASPTASRRRAAAADAARARPATRRSPRRDRPRHDAGVRPPGAWWRWASARPSPGRPPRRPSPRPAPARSRAAAARPAAAASCGMSNSPPSISSCIVLQVARVDAAQALLHRLLDALGVDLDALGVVGDGADQVVAQPRDTRRTAAGGRPRAGRGRAGRRSRVRRAPRRTVRCWPARARPCRRRPAGDRCRRPRRPRRPWRRAPSPPGWPASRRRPCRAWPGWDHPCAAASAGRALPRAPTDERGDGLDQHLPHIGGADDPLRAAPGRGRGDAGGEVGGLVEPVVGQAHGVRDLVALVLGRRRVRRLGHGLAGGVDGEVPVQRPVVRLHHRLDLAEQLAEVGRAAGEELLERRTPERVLVVRRRLVGHDSTVRGVRQRWLSVVVWQAPIRARRRTTPSVSSTCARPLWTSPRSWARWTTTRRAG